MVTWESTELVSHYNTGKGREAFEQMALTQFTKWVVLPLFVSAGVFHIPGREVWYQGAYYSEGWCIKHAQDMSYLGLNFVSKPFFIHFLRQYPSRDKFCKKQREQLTWNYSPLPSCEQLGGGGWMPSDTQQQTHLSHFSGVTVEREYSFWGSRL